MQANKEEKMLVILMAIVACIVLIAIIGKYFL
jgi:hypothetical protein